MTINPAHGDFRLILNGVPQESQFEKEARQETQPGCLTTHGLLDSGDFDEPDGHSTHDNECHFCLEAQEEATRDFLRRQLGGNIGLNADWCVSAWHLYVDGEDRYLLDNEDGTYEVVTRKYREDDNDDIESVESFPESQLVDWVMRYKSLTTTQEHSCDACGVPVPEDEYLGYDKPNGDTEYLCEDCYHECWNPCDSCGTMTEQAQTKGKPGTGDWICEDCFTPQD